MHINVLLENIERLREVENKRHQGELARIAAMPCEEPLERLLEQEREKHLEIQAKLGAELTRKLGGGC